MNQIFKDISNFNNTSDYLPIFAGVIWVETFVIYFTFVTNRSKILRKWYIKFGLAAVITDVLIIIIGIIISRFLYPFIFTGFTIWKFIGLTLFIQIIHDILFYYFFSLVPKGMNEMIDVFKSYAAEVKGYAVLGDSVIIISSCLTSSYLAGFSFNLNIINLIVTLYFIPYLIYHR